ncbi:hypothetical protein G6549_23555 [Bacillus sp. MM2020_1]|nr:hypothetical protein [Bacillus sp. MM2020_1]
MNNPTYQSDRLEESINGYAEHPYRLPGVECTGCGETWATTNIIHYGMPANLVNIPELNKNGTVSNKRHLELQTLILKQIEDYEGGVLLHGKDFQPVYLDIDNEPKVDFLWSCTGSVLISERIKDLFIKNEIKGVKLSPVIKRKVENKVIKYPFKVSENGGNYSELIITANSKRPPGAEIISICKNCGRKDFDNNARQLIMLPDMWCGEDIFSLNTTLWIIVTDRVKSLIEGIDASNVQFEKV